MAIFGVLQMTCLMLMRAFPQKTFLHMLNVSLQEVDQITSMIRWMLLSHGCESGSLGKVASEWIYSLCESDTEDEQQETTAGSFSQFIESNFESLGLFCVPAGSIQSPPGL